MRRTPTLTEQVRRHIRDKIHNGEFADGRIPPEAELASDLGVSRTTVRDALTRLQNEGAIFRRQGAGTFVNQAGLQIKTPIDEVWSYEQALAAHGYTPSVELVSAGERAGTLTVDKVFRENGDPVVFTSNRIPLDLVTESYTEDDLRRPIYEFLEVHCGRYLAYYLTDVVPVSAPKRIAELLAVRPRTALLSFEETGYDRDNELVVSATSHFRDDLLRFRVIRRSVA